MAHVVVIGAGYAGLAASRAARNGGAHVTLIESTGHHQLMPRLAAVAAGVLPATGATIRLTDLPLDDGSTEQVTHIDQHRKQVHTGQGLTIPYDALVVSTGATRSLPNVEGVAEHAWFLRNAADALALRQKLHDSHRPVVVVGGGPTGVQLAADVASTGSRSVALVEAEDVLLPAFVQRVGAQAERLLGSQGVHVHHGYVQRVTANGIQLAGGTFLPGTVVWAASMPTEGNALLPDASLAEGRLVVDYAQQVSPGVFAAGDVGAQRTISGELLPKSAQVAVRSGALAGANAAAVANGRRVKTKAFSFKGAVIPVGPHRGVTDLPLISRLGPLGQRLVPAIHWLIDLHHLIQSGGFPAAVKHRPQRIAVSSPAPPDSLRPTAHDENRAA